MNKSVLHVPIPQLVHGSEKLTLESGVRHLVPHHFPDVSRFPKLDSGGVLGLQEVLNNVYRIPRIVPGTF